MPVLGEEGREEKAEGKDRVPESTGELLEVCGVCVAVSREAMEGHCAPWEPQPGVTQPAADGLTAVQLLIYGLEDLSSAHCRSAAVLGAASSVGFAVCAGELMEQPRAGVHSSPAAHPSLPEALSDKLCCAGSAAGSKEEQCLSVSFVV